MPKCCRVLAVGCEIYTKPRGQLFDVMLCMGDKLGGLFVHNLLGLSCLPLHLLHAYLGFRHSSFRYGP